MSTVQNYLNYAEIALASYAGPLALSSEANEAEYLRVGMAESQAIQFDKDWSVLGQAEIGDGFSAALFQKVDAAGNPTGEKVLGIRGTDASHWAIDYSFNVIAIALLGTNLGTRQYASLNAFYQQMVSTGKLGAAEKLTVSGHSLGGFLAQAFAAQHHAVVMAAYTYNSPGFAGPIPVGGFGSQLLELFGITDASIPSDKIFNARAVDGLSATAGLGQMIGYVNTFNIEKSDPVSDHSIVTLTDSLAVQGMLSTLDVALSQSAANAMVQAATNQHGNTLERLLDSVRRMTLGAAAAETAIGDRNALHANLKTLTDSAAFQALAGKVTLSIADTSLAGQAKTDFAAFLSLSALSPVVISTTDSTVIASLKQANETVAHMWEADLALTQAQRAQGMASFTDAWFTDRAVLLGAMVAHNTKDGSGVAYVDGMTKDRAYDLQWTDANGAEQILIAENTARQGGVLRPVPLQRFAFGNDLANTLTGTDNLLSDHLYGGAGSDALSAMGGADYLEGNTGDDTLDGGAGNDQLLGGTGTDTYLFTGNFGKDSITDADGLGQIQIDGHAIGLAKAQAHTAGQPNVWVAELGDGPEVRMSVYDDATSATGKKLVITRAGSPDDTVTINHFNLAQATDQTKGFLGIKLANKVMLAPGTSPLASEAALPPSTVTAGVVQAFTIYLLAAPDKVASQVTLKLTDVAFSDFKLVNGLEVLDFNPDGTLQLTLPVGRDSLSLSLLNTSTSQETDSDKLSVDYTDASGAVTASNALTVVFESPGPAEESTNAAYVCFGISSNQSNFRRAA